MSKKHLNFGQCLEFLKFGQGNRGLNQQNRRKSKEKIRKHKEKQRKFDKKIRVRDPYFLLKNLLFNIFGVKRYKKKHDGFLVSFLGPGQTGGADGGEKKKL